MMNDDYTKGYYHAFELFDEIARTSTEIIEKDIGRNDVDPRFATYDEAYTRLSYPIVVFSSAHVLKSKLLNFLYLHANTKGGEHVANIAVQKLLGFGDARSASSFVNLYRANGYSPNAGKILSEATNSFNEFFVEDSADEIARRLSVIKRLGIRLDAAFLDIDGVGHSLATKLASYIVEDEEEEQKYWRALDVFAKANVPLQTGKTTALEQENDIFLRYIGHDE